MTTTKYKALLRFQGHPPGSEFEADLDPGLEKQAIKRGQIQPVKGAKKEKEESNDG